MHEFLQRFMRGKSHPIPHLEKSCGVILQEVIHLDQPISEQIPDEYKKENNEDNADMRKEGYDVI
jgi:hypothetical protein